MLFACHLTPSALGFCHSSPEYKIGNNVNHVVGRERKPAPGGGWRGNKNLLRGWWLIKCLKRACRICKTRNYSWNNPTSANKVGKTVAISEWMADKSVSYRSGEEKTTQAIRRETCWDTSLTPQLYFWYVWLIVNELIRLFLRTLTWERSKVNRGLNSCGQLRKHIVWQCCGVPSGAGGANQTATDAQFWYEGLGSQSRSHGGGGEGSWGFAGSAKGLDG